MVSARVHLRRRACNAVVVLRVDGCVCNPAGACGCAAERGGTRVLAAVRLASVAERVCD